MEGRDAATACAWLADRPRPWVDAISHVTLDLSGTYRKVADTMLPTATQVADPFHVVKLANQCVDETRRRVQQKVLGHRGRKTDPLHRIRKLLIMAEDRLDDDAMSRRQGLLAAGDPRGEVADAWTAKQAVQELYDINDPAIALDWVRELADSCTDGAYAPEIRRLGRTLRRWAEPIAAWHASRATNGPVEAINNLAKRLKRVAFGLTNWTHWRIRVLLYAGKPDWSKLATSPRHPRELPKRWHTSRASSTSCRHRRVRRGCAARRRRRSRPREHEVLQLLARGLRNKEIGEELHLSPKTMMHHTVAIYRKLGVRGRAEAAVTAARDGLVVLG